MLKTNTKFKDPSAYLDHELNLKEPNEYERLRKKLLLLMNTLHSDKDVYFMSDLYQFDVTFTWTIFCTNCELL